MTNKILLSVGLALIIGVLSGYYFSEEKYYYMIPTEPKREIPEAAYEDLLKGDYSKWVKIEKEFNQTNAIAISIGSFGVFLIIGSFFKKKND